MDRDAAIHALQWHLDAGVDEALSSSPVDATKMPEKPKRDEPPAQTKPQTKEIASEPILGASDAKREAIKLAKSVKNLDELKQAIASFDGLDLKNTAANLVFSDGNDKADVMLIGEAPGADEDRFGKPFVGESGQLLDKIVSYIDLARDHSEPANAIYLSNVLNWRPPGNRTPSPAEIEVSLAFIEKHIALVQPKILVFCGGVPAKAMLNASSGISKLRGKFHEYTPVTKELFDTTPSPIPAIATYHPSNLITTPSQKRLVWQDMILLKKKLTDISA